MKMTRFQEMVSQYRYSLKRLKRLRPAIGALYFLHLHCFYLPGAVDGAPAKHGSRWAGLESLPNPDPAAGADDEYSCRCRTVLPSGPNQGEEDDHLETWVRPLDAKLQLDNLPVLRVSKANATAASTTPAPVFSNITNDTAVSK